VVLILADDLGFSDIGCYGGEIETPNLDRLAAEGMRFTQFYNCGVCRTTRATLLTGVHPRRRNRGRLLHPEMVTVAEVLKGAGYQTSLTGKWHFPQKDIGFPIYRPTDRGFDEYYGIAEGCCSFFDPSKAFPAYDKGVTPIPFLHNEEEVTEFPDDYYATDAFTDHAIEQIEKFSPAARDGDSPFFVHLCYTAPHYPLHAKPEDIAKYAGRYDDGYFVLRERRRQRLIELGLIDENAKLSKDDLQLGEFRYDYAMTPWEDIREADREREIQRMEVYAAMVDSMDQGIGRVMAALEENGVGDNTLVMFLSDNGGCASHVGYNDEEVWQQYREYNSAPAGSADTHEYVGPGWGWAQNSPFRRYKVWTYEGGIATPMIAHWPGKVEAGAIAPAVGHVVDFMPTLMELGKAEYPQQRDGVDVLLPEGESFLPVLTGEVEKESSRMFFWGLYGNRAVRQGKWKMVWGSTGKKWELYNLKVDRTETADVIEKHPHQAKRMEQAWLRWAKETGYPLTGNAL